MSTDSITSSDPGRSLLCEDCASCPFRSAEPAYLDGSVLSQAQRRVLAAGVYASFGYAVYPCRSDSPAQASGIPNGPRGGGLALATADLAQVLSEQWNQVWSRETTNFGVRTGLASHLIVIDLDHKKTRDIDPAHLEKNQLTIGELQGREHDDDCCGAESLRAWENENNVEIPRDAVVRTPGGGQHIWLLLPLTWTTHVPKRIGWLKNVDLLWDGHMVRSAPSIRAASTDKVAGEYVFTAGCPCQVPIASEELLLKIVGTPSVQGVTGHAGSSGSNGTVDIDRYLREGIPMGHQDEELHKAACCLARRGESEEDILQTLWKITQASDQNQKDPWTIKHLASKTVRAVDWVHKQQLQEQTAMTASVNWARQLGKTGVSA